MPSVLAISIPIDHIDIYDLPTEPHRTRRAQKGFWRTLAQYVAWFRVRRTHHMQHLCAVSHQLDRQSCLHSSTLSYLQAFSGL